MADMYGGSLNSVTWIPASARASWSAAPVTSWDVTSVSSSSIHKTCCHCNKNIDVLITAAVGGSHFRLRFNGANTYYLLHSITVAKEGSYTAPNHDASTQVGVSVGAIGGTSQITIAAHSQVWTDWITYDVQVRLPFLRLTSVQPPCRSADHLELYKWPISQANTRYVVSFFHVCGPDYYSQWSTSSASSWVDGSARNYVYDIDRLEVQ